MQTRRCWPAGLLLVTIFVGCADVAPSEPDTPPTTALAAQFDASTTGTIQGAVRWQGPIPAVVPFRSTPTPAAPPPHPPERVFPNPNAPVIDPATKGVADVVVFLRAVDPARSRPWCHETARVEVEDHRCRIRQGTQTSRVGVVRRGEEIELSSRDGAFWSLRGRGAAFFSHSLPDADTSVHRRLPESGVVELSGNGGRYWLRAYLFVLEHPYWTRTTAGGRFTLEQVPEGTYELICWSPNWQPEHSERDINTTLNSRVTFRPPVVISRTITVRRGKTAAMDYSLSAAEFGTASK